MKRILSVVLLSFAFVSRAELTASQLTSAMVAALKQYAQYSSGFDYATITIPSNFQTDWDIASFLDTSSNSSSGLAARTEYYFSRWNPIFLQLLQNSTFTSNVASRITQKLTTDLQDFLTRSDENHYRLPESVYSISMDSDHICKTVDDILFLLQTQLDTTLGNLASYLSSIDSGINGIDSQLQAALNSSLSDLETILRDVSSYAGDIYTYLGDQEELLQAISDHTDDTATGVSQIMNWLTYNFENVLLEVFGESVLQVDWSGLPDHFNVSVDNWPSNSLDTVHSYLSNLLASAQLQASNSLGIASTLEDWYPVAMTQATNVQTLANDVGSLLLSSTNYFSSMLLSSTDQQKIQQATNDLEQLAVDDEEEAADLDRTWSTQDVATVTIAPPEEPYYPENSDDLNLGNVNTSLNHGRTVLLTTGAASFGIPRMEVDLFRDSGTSNFVSTLSALIRAGWAAIFGIWTAVLYYGAFRRAKGMLLATQCAGKGPNSVDLEIGFATDHGGIL